MSILGNTTTWYETKHHKPTCHNGMAMVLVVVPTGNQGQFPLYTMKRMILLIPWKRAAGCIQSSGATCQNLPCRAGGRKMDKIMEFIGLPLVGALFVFSIFVLATGEWI